MNENSSPQSVSPRLLEDQAHAELVEGQIALAARWLQIAAIVWLVVLSPSVLAYLSIAEILYWFSWLVMAAGSFTMIAIALRNPRLRWGLIRTMILLWLFLAIVLTF